MTKPLDVVAIIEDLPNFGLSKGQVGTIVEELANGVMLVEFADLGGIAYAIELLHVGQLMELHHQPEMAA